MGKIPVLGAPCRKGPARSVRCEKVVCKTKALALGLCKLALRERKVPNLRPHGVIRFATNAGSCVRLKSTGAHVQDLAREDWVDTAASILAPIEHHDRPEQPYQEKTLCRSDRFKVDAKIASQRVESELRELSDIVIVGGVGHAEPRVCPNGVCERNHVLDRHSICVSAVPNLLAIAPSHIRLRVGVVPVHEAQGREVLQRLDE
eukprot:1871741-Rhodomonas_salina.4